jgi:hypothetical protein
MFVPFHHGPLSSSSSSSQDHLRSFVGSMAFQDLIQQIEQVRGGGRRGLSTTGVILIGRQEVDIFFQSIRGLLNVGLTPQIFRCIINERKGGERGGGESGGLVLFTEVETHKPVLLEFGSWVMGVLYGGNKICC